MILRNSKEFTPYVFVKRGLENILNLQLIANYCGYGEIETKYNIRNVMYNGSFHLSNSQVERLDTFKYRGEALYYGCGIVFQEVPYRSFSNSFPTVIVGYDNSSNPENRVFIEDNLVCYFWTGLAETDKKRIVKSVKANFGLEKTRIYQKDLSFFKPFLVSDMYFPSFADYLPDKQNIILDKLKAQLINQVEVINE